MVNFTKLFALAVLFFSANTLLAQDVPEPEFNSRLYYLDSTSTLVSFERTDAPFETKIKALGFGGGDGYLTLPRPKSKVRFHANSIPKIVIKTSDGEDPADIIKIVPISNISDKGERILKVVQVGYGTVFTGHSKVNHDFLEIAFKKIRPQLYQLVFDNIQPGEYAVYPNEITNDKPKKGISTYKIYSFGVD